MPRILPRLLKALQESKLRSPTQPAFILPGLARRRNRKKSLWQPLPSEYSLSPHGRTQSILLDEFNPVAHCAAFVAHKTLPPKVHLDEAVQKTRIADGEEREDRPRSMTQEERGWWANPYLRMLSGPLRSCLITEERLPTDLLLRLAPMKLPAPRNASQANVVLPDGIEHPLFRRSRNGSGVYVMCNKTIVDLMVEKPSWKRIAPNLSMHSRFAEQIGHLLRVRVLQELELLAERLSHRPLKAHEYPILRRLTRAEFKTVKNTETIPFEGAIALLIVPPVNRDPATKQRPTPSFSIEPIEDEDKIPSKPLPPLSVLHPTALEEDPEDAVEEDLEDAVEEDLQGAVKGDPELPTFLPSAKVPLYNGLTLFPARKQRAALHAALNKVLRSERRTRQREYRENKPEGKLKSSDQDPSNEDASTEKRQRAKGDDKASHAYVLCSDAERMLRVDPVPLAIALWRVRMWEKGNFNLPVEERWKLKPRPIPS